MFKVVMTSCSQSVLCSAIALRHSLRSSGYNPPCVVILMYADCIWGVCVMFTDLEMKIPGFLKATGTLR